MSALKRWNTLTAFVKLLAYSGHVANGRPQSVFLVSEPGQGKSELLNRFDLNTKYLDYYSDLTYKTLVTVAGRIARGSRTTHVVCTEFQKVINRRRHIAESTLTILLQAMEEGLTRVGFGPEDHDLRNKAGQPSRFGIFAATTYQSVRQNPFLFSDLAMDSRAYVVDAMSTEAELKEIEERIKHGDTRALTKIELRHVPETKLDVHITPRLADKVQRWREEMDRKQVRTYGVRTFTRFLHSVRGVALSHGRQVVKQEDLDEFYAFRELWLKPAVPNDVPDQSSRRVG